MTQDPCQYRRPACVVCAPCVPDFFCQTKGAPRFFYKHFLGASPSSEASSAGPATGPRWRPQQYLGHREISHKVRYTELAADRFAGLWAG